MFKTLVNAWKTIDLRKKILFTLLILLLYRVGACITVPFIGYAEMEQVGYFGGVLFSGYSIFGDSMTATNLLTLMSGNAFSQATLFALGVSPYITSSIVMQLLTVAIPPLERLAKSEDGKNKINSITRYVTVLLALVSSIGYYVYLNSVGAVTEKGFFFAVVIIACYCAGSSLVMWLAEKINEFGIGNGVSLILFANIVSRAPTLFITLYQMITSQFKSNVAITDAIATIAYVVLMSAFVLFLLWFIIFISDSERRIPVQYAKKVVGRKMYGGQNTNLPIKLNMTGVMPIIFASTILNLPSTLNLFLNGNKGWQKFMTLWNSGLNPVSIILNLIFILAFAYFYVAISFNPTEVAGNLQKNGGSIPGIRPGRPTSEFIKKVLSKITFIGALALAVIAVVPTLIQYILMLGGFQYMISDYVFAGSSIIIVVGVILETVKEIETQMSMRHYKGFLE